MGDADDPARAGRTNPPASTVLPPVPGQPTPTEAIAAAFSQGSAAIATLQSIAAGAEAVAAMARADLARLAAAAGSEPAAGDGRG